MLKKYIRSTIIIMLCTLLPVVFLMILAPQVISMKEELHQTQSFFILHREGFLIAHALFYLSAVLIWPKAIRWIAHANEAITPAQIKLAITARWYLLSALVFFELLFWWK